MNLCRTLFITSVLLFAAARGDLQCGNNICGGDNACCDDARMGPTCYDPLDNGCVSNGLGTLTLCGEAEQACGPVCFEPQNYFCCNGNLMQNGQSCAGSPTTARPTSAAPTTASPTSSQTTAAPQNNCPGAADTPGVNCPAGSTCCGYGTMTPSCINNTDTSVKCCVYYLSSTQCPADATCGGILGPGASSDALCGPAGSTFCDAGFNYNAFCSGDQECCTNGGTGLCCPAGSACGFDECTPPTGAPTTAQPTTPAPNNCPGAGGSPGVNCPSGTYCCGYGTIEPQCVNNSDTSVQCCTYFLSATLCPSNSTCGGSYGPGASSEAQCGPAGTTWCEGGEFLLNSFCSAGEVCCISTGNGFCCPAGNTCGSSYFGECNAP